MTGRGRSATLSAVGFLLASGLAACGADPSADGSAASPSTEITVFAAASLTGSFTELGRRFEAAGPGRKVTFSFGPSSGLATQITEGAPVDVFAAASDTTMAQVVGAGLASSPAVFATNSLQIAVPPSNPAHVDSLDDLDDSGVKVVLCQAQVPCGVAADRTLAKAGLTVTPVSREADVKAVLTKVALDEADAGLVYVTDVKAAGGDVVGVELSAGQNTSTNYPIATVTRADTDPATQATAQAFVDFVLSAEGGSVLRRAGFTPPP